jgi:hypothetical protein
VEVSVSSTGSILTLVVSGEEDLSTARVPPSTGGWPDLTGESGPDHRAST